MERRNTEGRSAPRRAAGARPGKKRNRVPRLLVPAVLCALCVLLLAGGLLSSHRHHMALDRKLTGPFGMAEAAEAVEARGGYFLRTAVIYGGDGANGEWESVLRSLE